MISQYKIYKYSALIVLVLLAFCLNGQNVRNSNWLFSANTEQQEGSEGSSMQFRDNGVDTSRFTMENQMFLSTSLISDNNGDLIIFSNGCGIYNNSFSLVEDGAGLSEGGWIEERDCPYLGYGGTRDIILLPQNDSIFYLIHKFYEIEEQPFLNLFASQVLQTKILLRNGEVQILSKNEIVMDRLRLGMGYMHAAENEDKSGWWISQVADSADSIYIFGLNDEGLFLNEAKPFDVDIQSASGQACFSPDGSTFSVYTRFGGLNIFDFDVENGILEFRENITLQDSFSIAGYCVSPSSRFGYISSGREMWQVDLWDESGADRVVLIDTFDGFGDPLPTRFAYGQLGPNCKLYFASSNSSKYLHVIHQPNLKGKACQFKQHDLKLPHYYNPGSIPNLPYYRDDPDLDCGDVLPTDDIEEENGITLFPNPTNGLLTISWDELPAKFLVEIYDLDGRLLITRENARTLDISPLSGGLYIVSVRSKGVNSTKRVIKFD